MGRSLERTTADSGHREANRRARKKAGKEDVPRWGTRLFRQRLRQVGQKRESLQSLSVYFFHVGADARKTSRCLGTNPLPAQRITPQTTRLAQRKNSDPNRCSSSRSGIPALLPTTSLPRWIVFSVIFVFW